MVIYEKQSGNVPASGAGGSWFKSSHLDHFLFDVFHRLSTPNMLAKNHNQRNLRYCSGPGAFFVSGMGLSVGNDPDAPGRGFVPVTSPGQ